MTDSDHPEVAPSPSTRARDHMANERTYLAWLRTAATVMALGLAVASFADSVSWSSAAAGVLLVAVGAAGIVYGTRRYRQVT
ncbi:YidH family protein [uncultured Jatrophihabitans sp.]|uniref:YidH family protein n=1 Tax=uncultured Jatrophihabitans sp. TaxID=1610747 RepID=UPI0035CA9226